MRSLHPVPFLTVALTLFLAGQAAGQAQAAPPAAAINGVVCLHCYRVSLPLGFTVREVIDDGRYVTLEDGSTWEVRLTTRPVASSWQPGDFVQLKNISAPVDGYEMLLSHGDNDKVEARLAGRGRPQGTGLPD
jgi:hypothetical protein